MRPTRRSTPRKTRRAQPGNCNLAAANTCRVAAKRAAQKPLTQRAQRTVIVARARRTHRHRAGLAPNGEPRRALRTYAKLPERQTKRAKHHPGRRQRNTGCAPDRPAVKSASCGVRTHAQLPAVDLKSTPLTSRANWRRCGPANRAGTCAMSKAPKRRKRCTEYLDAELRGAKG